MCFVSRHKKAVSTSEIAVTFIVTIAALLNQSMAQNDTLPAFNATRTPTSPAFVLMGVEPTSVERPNSPSALAVSILNRTQNFSALPKDYALEVSPYWLASHPDLTWRSDTARNIGESLIRTLTISGGTALDDSEASTSVLSFAVRGNICSGTMTPRTQQNLTAAESLLGDQSRIFNVFLKKYKAESMWEDRKSNELAGAHSIAETVAVLQKFERMVDSIGPLILEDPDYREAIAASTEELNNLMVTREGFLLEAAAGVVWRFPESRIDTGRFARFGFWLTPAYQLDDLSIVGVFRYLHDQEPLVDLYDVGMRFIYTGSNLALSCESVHRTARPVIGTPDQYRLAGVLNYRIQKGIWLNATFGKNYDSNSRGSLLAQLGLSFDFMGKEYNWGNAPPGAR